jgi:hypothetical protein
MKNNAVAKRCKCDRPQPDDGTAVVRCKSCAGWIVARIHSFADLELLRKDVRRDDDSGDPVSDGSGPPV